ncbi:MAG: CRISPR-associated endonuclease Cas2 [Anaerolineales bacterium]|nr:CRISPR-associated endonuclease Cas2 [Anaerolineales bacterium]
MEFLVTYDVSTETRAGRRRLHRVAKRCEGFGQRVQKSVFECILDEAGLERLKHALAKEIKESEDSLRIYRLMEPRERYLQVIGLDIAYDVHKPLVL